MNNNKDDNRLAAVETILSDLALKMQQSQAEFDRRSAEFDRKLEESRVTSEQKNAEFDRRSAEFDRRSAELDRRSAEFDRGMQELKQSQAETDRIVKNLAEQVTGISKSNGLAAEDYFFNSFQKDSLNFFGEKFDKVVRGKGTIINDEYDFVLINGKTAGIVEVKYKARKEDIAKALKKVDTFRTNFPEYKDHKIYLAIAAFSINSTLENECKKQGIAVIKQEGDKVIVYDKHLKAF